MTIWHPSGAKHMGTRPTGQDTETMYGVGEYRPDQPKKQAHGARRSGRGFEGGKMMESVKSLLAGMACGAVFALLRLPTPAPPVLAGVVGIVGVVLGTMLARRVMP